MLERLPRTPFTALAALLLISGATIADTPQAPTQESGETEATASNAPASQATGAEATTEDTAPTAPAEPQRQTPKLPGHYTNDDLIELGAKVEQVYTNADLTEPASTETPAVFTNDDLVADDSAWATTSVPPAEAEGDGTEANPEQGEASLAWLKQHQREVTERARIDAAQRRLRDAERHLTELRQSIRSTSESRDSAEVEERYFRDVTQQGTRLETRLEDARAEVAAARADLSRLLASANSGN